jgi:hypothetical protein
MKTGNTYMKKRGVSELLLNNLELNERLQELENQKHLVEQARQEKKNLNHELEALKRETLTLKRVKD